MRISRFNLLIGVIVLVVLVFVVVGFILNDVSNEPIECIDVSAVTGFVYDVCYDSYTQNVFMLVKGESDYYLDTFRVSFFDGRNRSYDLGYNVDNASQLYKFYALRNPSEINLDLNVLGADVSCEKSRELSVRYCDTRRPGKGRGSLNGSRVEDYVSLAPSDIGNYSFGVNYSEKEKLLMDICRPEWECSEWEECDGVYQRRTCVDLNECEIPIGSPDSVRYCGEECVEEWSCEWGDCVDGFMEPDCIDLNNCGTKFDKPREMSCISGSVCRPDVFCGEWGKCEVDYGLLDLVRGSVGGLAGIKSRVCIDRNGCVESRTEFENCSVGVDVYTKKFDKCGEEFIGVYNKLDDKLIARIRGGEDEPSVDIYFDDRGEGSYCDYCYDGILNYDEEGIDCGGGCMSCNEKYKINVFKRKSWLDKILDWVRGLF